MAIAAGTSVPVGSGPANASPTPRVRARRGAISLGFAARLGFATSLLIAFVCLTQSWVLARGDLEQVRRYLVERGRWATDSLARETAPSLVAGNLGALQRLAEQTRAEAAVIYVRFWDPQGLLLVSVGGAGSGAEETEEFSAPILSGPGGSVGRVAVGISLEPLGTLRRQRVRTVTLFTLLFTFSAVLGALLIARAITRPLKTLAAAADEIARGDLTTRVDVRSGDEIGALAGSFNAMVQSLATGRTTLEEKVEELETANRLKSEFLATVSHELRTPLNVIIGYAEMLADGRGGSVSEEQAGMLRAIQRYSQLQLDLVTNVLDFSRLASGKISFHVERFALAPLLTEILALQAGRLDGDRVRLATSIDARVPALETDRVKLQEIIRNLVDNAIKFTADGLVSVSARPAGDPDRVAIEVTDTGTGIAPDELESIFDAFRQLGETSTRNTGGVGLGLSIVKQLATALGGTVSVTSQLGRGSTFRVEIPCTLPGVERPPVVAALDEVTRNVASVPDHARPLLAAVPRGARARRTSAS